MLSNEKGLCDYEEGLEQNRCNKTDQFASFFMYEVMRSFHLLTDSLMMPGLQFCIILCCVYQCLTTAKHPTETKECTTQNLIKLKPHFCIHIYHLYIIMEAIKTNSPTTSTKMDTPVQSGCKCSPALHNHKVPSHWKTPCPPLLLL